MCSELKMGLRAERGEAADGRAGNTWHRTAASDAAVPLLSRRAEDPLPSEPEEGLESQRFLFLPPRAEMASDVSSLGAAVGSGNPGAGAQTGGAIVQRAAKRRPG